MLSIAVLGEVEATRDGVRLPLPAGKTRDLLVRLAVQPGVPVRVDTLIEDLWGAAVDRNTLQAKVSQLRRSLGEKDVVRGTAEAYTLVIDPDLVDASRASTIASDVAAASAAGRHADVVARAGEGLALFRGAPLVGQRDWAAPMRTALEEVRWSLVEHHVTARVALGGGGELVAELERLVLEEPLRERLWGALMTALYRAGRQADALSAYSRARTHLVEELGLEPGPELRALEAEVLAQADALAASIPGTALAPTNIPQTAGAMVGREDELGEVGIVLQERRTVTLVGLAGVGKTRLALEAARSSLPAGGAWVVRLDSLPATAVVDDLVRSVADALHVVPERDAVRERLGGAATLLVLDNCEHVVEAAAELADWLLTASPRLTLIATSQVSLGLRDERVVEVPPLTGASAVGLFEQLLTRAGRSITGADHHLVVEVCASLDGLPLAIELAAARVRSLPLDEIVRRLDDRFALLRDPSRPADRRHALEAALSWSYDLLFPDDQRALQALSCFAGGASFAATEAVLDALDVPRAAIADSLARLVDRSLVTLDVTTPVPRYRLLDSVRTHARERMRTAGLDGVALAGHAGWYADRAGACASGIRGSGQADWLDFVRAERADVDSALAWCADHDQDTGERIAIGFGWAWAVLGDGSVGAARVRDATVNASHDRLAQAALVAAWLEASAGDLDLAHEDLERAAAPASSPLARADLAWTRSFVAIQSGRPGVVLIESARALEAYRGLALEWHQGAALLVAAYGHLMSGDARNAGAAAAEALDLVEDTGDRWGLVHAHGILAGVAAAEGRLTDAADAFAGAADAAAGMGFTGQAALHLASRARILVVTQDPHSRKAVDLALEAATAVGDGRLAAGLRIHASQLARADGDIKTARALLTMNLAWYDSHGGGDREALTRVLDRAVANDAPGLIRLLDEDLDPAARQAALDAAGRLAAMSGDVERARALSKAADAIEVPPPDITARVDRTF